jgi:uncharacterized protein YcbK (DUF882 family)
MLRRLAIAAALTFMVAAPRSGRAEPAEAGDDDEASAPAALAPQHGSGGSADAPIPRQGHPRRGKAKHRYRFIGRVVPDGKLRADPLPKPSGHLHVVSLNGRNDEADVQIYNPDGSYDLEALAEINHVLRCRRTDTEKSIDPQLLMLLSHVYDHFGGKPLQIVSGYRNQRKQTSNHFKGRASDIRIAGVPPKKIEAFAETLDRGGMGIGIYPRGKFVHIDVRSPPSYRWIDYSPPNPNAPEKRPPRGWKRRHLES